MAKQKNAVAAFPEKAKAVKYFPEILLVSILGLALAAACVGVR